MLVLLCFLSAFNSSMLRVSVEYKIQGMIEPHFFTFLSFFIFLTPLIFFLFFSRAVSTSDTVHQA